MTAAQQTTTGGRRWGRMDWQDPFRPAEQLSDEQRMIAESARSLRAGATAPRVKDAFRSEHTDPAIFREMGELGLLGSTIRLRLPGVDYISYGLIAREVERVDSGYRSMMSVQSSLVMYPIYAYGTEAQREKYLPGWPAGNMIGCFGLTEPDHGSDPGAWSPGPAASTAATAVRRQDVDHQQSHRRCLRGLGQDRRRRDPRLYPGTRHAGPERTEDRGQARAARLRDRRDRHGRCLRARANLLPGVQGLKGPFGCLNNARYGIAWGVLGAAEACWHAAREYTLERRQFGGPWRPTSWYS
jgi:glutaryl-CoA dehydrogenase